jgi:hypothetical protein
MGIRKCARKLTRAAAWPTISWMIRTEFAFHAVAVNLVPNIAAE